MKLKPFEEILANPTESIQKILRKVERDKELDLEESNELKGFIYDNIHKNLEHSKDDHLIPDLPTSAEVNKQYKLASDFFTNLKISS